MKKYPDFLNDLIRAGKLDNSLSYKPDDNFFIGSKKIDKDFFGIRVPCSFEIEILKL